MEWTETSEGVVYRKRGRQGGREGGTCLLISPSLLS